MKYRINAEFRWSEIRSLVNLCADRIREAKNDMERHGIDLSATVEYYTLLREKLINGCERIDED